MPGLLIKDLPKVLHKRLKARAAANHRSLSREALVILEQALHDNAGPPSLTVVDTLRVKGARPLTDELIERAKTTGRP